MPGGDAASGAERGVEFLSRIANLIGSPSWLLHEIDAAGGRLIFLPVARATLARAAFLDGRCPLAEGGAATCTIDEALAAAAEAGPPGPDRFVFHMSFCGSTLIARILDRPAKALVLREPNILVGLADWKAAQARAGRADPRFAPMVALALASLRARWRPDEPVLIKPSNWVNNLLPELCAGDARAACIQIEPRPFLRAVFRGGRERMAFIARLVAHLAAGSACDEALLGAAIRSAPDPLGRIACLSLLALHLQRRRFRAAFPGHVPVGFDMISQRPIAAAIAVAEAVALDLTYDEVADGVARNLGLDAKQPGLAYSVQEHVRADAETEHVHGARFDDAMIWAADLLDPWFVGGDFAVRHAG